MKRIRGVRILLLAAALAGILMPAAGAAAPVAVTVHGTAVQWTDAAPYLEDGRTMVPLRAAAKAMGLEVQWHNAERRVDVSRTYTPQNSVYQAELETGGKEFLRKRTVSTWIGQRTYTIVNQYGTYDGNAVTEGRQHSRSGEMDAAPVIRENRTYLPIRYVAEQFGYDVLWDGASRTVRLVSELPVDWNYAWSISGVQDTEDPGSLILSVHTPSNLTGAAFTMVSVACTSAPGETDGVCEILPADDADLQRIRLTAGEDAQLLDTVRVEYPFQNGKAYTIRFALTLTKANGAVSAASGSFQVDLRQ